jgi:hypothetical protein
MRWLRRLRWLLLLILTVGCLVFALQVWVRVGGYFSGNPGFPFITGTAGYIALAPALFVVTFYTSLLLAVATWRSSTTGRKKWKAFWNVIEIVWLLGGGLSIINLLVTQATAIMPEIIAYYEQDASAARAKLQDDAKEVQSRFCTPTPEDGEICDRVGRLTRLVSDPAIPDDFGFRLILSTDNFIRAHRNDPSAQMLDELHTKMFDYMVEEGFVLREKDTRLKTVWSTSLIRSTPAIFAFVLALRLGRALAAFAL